ncbi:MAG: mobile mystery protein A [Idiomarina sp.]
MAAYNVNKPKSAVGVMVREHYKEIANSATKHRSLPAVPAEGWVRTIRKSLDMSGAQLAGRLNLSRNRVSVLERREVEGDITINQLKELADKLNCDLTYALVPKKNVNLILEERAEKLAKTRVATNSQNMFLEAQMISPEKQQLLVEELKNELLAAGGRLLWRNSKGEG